jgi:hypothetical protein
MVLELRAGKHPEARPCLCSSLARLGRSTADAGAVAVVEKMAFRAGPSSVASGQGCSYHAVAHCCYDLAAGKGQGTTVAAPQGAVNGAAAAPAAAGPTVAAGSALGGGSKPQPQAAAAYQHSKKQQKQKPQYGSGGAAAAKAGVPQASVQTGNAAATPAVQGPLRQPVPSITKSNTAKAAEPQATATAKTGSAAAAAAAGASMQGPLGQPVPSVTRSFAAGSRGALVPAPVEVNWWTWPADNSK